MNAEIREDRISLVADVIRQQSHRGELTSAVQVEEALKAVAVEDDGRKTPEILNQAIENQPDLRVLEDDEGSSWYYSIDSMSQMYARILLWGKAPVTLIAEVVRENATLYPRPVPLDMFEDHPFNLEPVEIQSALRTMAEEARYGDICFTSTSAKTIYLYSNQYMDHAFASMLAEREDVDLIEDP